MPDQDLQDYEETMRRQKQMAQIRAKYDPNRPRSQGLGSKAANGAWNWFKTFATTPTPKRKRMEK